MHECLDGCLLQSQLSEIQGISFPGAFGRDTVGTIWKAWIACSIFGRTDVDLGEKIKLFGEGAVCIEAKALEKVLRFAFDKCTTWTEFICSRSGVQRHTPVESYEITKMYDEALKALKLDMALAERNRRPTKEGPVGFLAPRCAAALERDGLQGGIQTRVVVQFNQLPSILETMKHCRTWVIMWPKDLCNDNDAITMTSSRLFCVKGASKKEVKLYRC